MMQEAEENCIDLPEDDPDMIRRLIAYLYLGDYDPCTELVVPQFDSIKQHESITSAASVYHRRQDCDLCACLAPNTNNVEQLVSEIQSNNSLVSSHKKPRNAVEIDNPLTIHAAMYALADKYHVNGLSEIAKTKFENCLSHHVNSEDFVIAVQLVYSSTPKPNRGLRDVVIKAFLIHFQVNVTEVPGLEDKLDRIDELSFLLIKSWPTKTDRPKPAVGSAVASAPPAPSATTAPVTRTNNLFRAIVPAAVPPAVPNSGFSTRNAPALTWGTSSRAPAVTAAGNSTSSTVLSFGTQPTPSIGSLFSNAPQQTSTGPTLGGSGSAQGSSTPLFGFGGSR
jgi:hypothetical protein